jgi:uncharacterized protein (DUF2344 family)
MKKGRAFLGAFFISFGGFHFVDNFSTLSLSWGSDLWPLILILLGFIFIVKSDYIKTILSLIAGFIAGLTLYSSVNGKVLDFDFFKGNDYDKYESNLQYIPKDDSLVKAYFEFDATISQFEINETNEFTLKIESEEKYSNLEIIEGEEDEIKKFTVKRRFKKLEDLEDSNYKILLNRNVEWDVKVESKAGKARLNLLNLNVKNLNTKIYATLSEIIFPNYSDECKAKIKIYASNVKLFFPKNSGVQISSKDFGSNIRFHGFVKKEKNIYHTENFDSSSKKIYVELTTGASNIEINYY